MVISLYNVVVSIPYATALTLAVSDLTTKTLFASITIPVLSSTPLAGKSTSNSKKSEFEGVPLVDSANLIFAACEPLLQTDTVTTENVSGGTVYIDTSVLGALKSADPSLPVAIIYISIILKSS
jgi:hypothetical protein